MPLPPGLSTVSHVVIHATRTHEGWIVQMTTNRPGNASDSHDEVVLTERLGGQILSDRATVGDVAFFTAMTISAWAQADLTR